MDDQRDNQDIHLDIKKKIMFSKEEDYYFITYNLLIILNTFNCTSINSKWTDYKKISYILPLVADSSLLGMYLRYLDEDSQPKKNDYELMRDTYIKSRLRLKLITSILFTLEKEDLVGIIKNEKRNTIDIWINREKISGKLLKSNLFSIESNNSLKLKKSIPRLRSIGTKTLLERLYVNNGVRVWDA